MGKANRQPGKTAAEARRGDRERGFGGADAGWTSRARNTSLSWQEYLENQKQIKVTGKKVAVLGGGAVAVDCATTAKRHGALSVELIYRRKQENMPLTAYEREMLLEHGIEISSCSKPLAVIHEGGTRQRPPHRADDAAAKENRRGPENFVVNKKESPVFREFDVVISAIGSRPKLPITKAKGIFYAGDMVLGAATVVEAVATGKNAALEADAFIRGAKPPANQEPRQEPRGSGRHALLPRARSTRSSLAARFARRSCSPPRRTRTATPRCARPTSAAGPAA